VILKKLRVLVVDDDLSIRKLMASALEQEGYETLEAASGVEALHIAETNSVDFLITDAEMPEMSGPELIMKLRTQDLIKKVLLVSGNGPAVTHPNAALRPIPLLPKPFTTAQLLREIDSILVD
jgi:CheY-like chemotaxis protein